jgi:hypothetical protein
MRSSVDNLQERGAVALLKIISFRQFHIAQTRAQTPILIRALAYLLTPFNQFPNIFFILVGGGILKVK